MTSLRRPLRAIASLLVLLGFGLTCVRAAEVRLVATVNGQDFDQIVVSNEILGAQTANGPQPLPQRTTWKLEGDAASIAALARLSPAYSIVREERVGGIDPSQTHAARISLYNGTGNTDIWESTDLSSGVLVAVWIVDGKPVAVLPDPLPPRNLLGVVPASISIPLDENTRRGAPAILLWSNGRFVAPQPVFRDAAAQAALVAMHFGSAADFEAALAGVRDVDVLSTNRFNLPHVAGLVPEKSSEPIGASKDQFTLLHAAAEGGFTEAYNALVRKGARVRTTGSGARPIEWAAMNGRVKTLEAALAHDAQSAIRAQTIAIRAVTRRHLDAAVMLADASEGWAKWGDALDRMAEVASLTGDLKVMRQLIEKGEGKRLTLATPRALVAAALRGDAEYFQVLLPIVRSARVDDRKTTPLHAAAQVGSEAVVNLLLEARAEVGAVDADGRTPLMLAARNGHTGIVRTLLAREKQDLERRDISGVTPLHLAVLGGKPEIVSMLLEAKAKTDVTSSGLTPLEFALTLQSPAMVDLLVPVSPALDPKHAQRERILEGVIALNRAEMYRRLIPADLTVEEKKTAETLRSEWPAGWLARYFGSTAIPVEGTPVPPLLASGVTPDRRPVLRVGVVRPLWLGGAPRRTRVEATAVGLVDKTGAFVFPRIEGVADEATRALILASTVGWRFEPATKDGQPVNFPVRLRVSIPADLPMVFEESQVDQTARVTRSEEGPDSLGPLATNQTFRGEIVASIVVNPDGRPASVELLSTTEVVNPKTVENIFYNFRFQPALRNGEAVPSRVTLRIGEASDRDANQRQMDALRGVGAGINYEM